MTPSRWREIERVYAAALDRPLEERDALLRRACGDDAGLRRMVESLLEAPTGDGLHDLPVLRFADLLPDNTETRSGSDATIVHGSTSRGRGVTRAALRWGEQVGRWRRLDREVYAMGADPPNELDRARARVLAAGAVASGGLAGVLHGLDGVVLDGRPVRRRCLPARHIVAVDGVRCTDGWQTLVDLAATLDDTAWEHALESALRSRSTTVSELATELHHLGRSRTPGTARIRRVLGRRPSGAPPTESLLETLMVQLVREVEDLGEPARQNPVHDADGNLVARAGSVLAGPRPVRRARRTASPASAGLRRSA